LLREPLEFPSIRAWSLLYCPLPHRFPNRCANPSFSGPELVHQLAASHATLIISHPASLDTARAAGRDAGISADRIVVFDVDVDAIPKMGVPSVSQLVLRGISREASFVERKLRPGEAKTKLALLNFSSGTTGKPKVPDLAGCYVPV
jgi:4-coumarate--CoA ligase